MIESSFFAHFFCIPLDYSLRFFKFNTLKNRTAKIVTKSRHIDLKQTEESDLDLSTRLTRDTDVRNSLLTFYL